MSSTLTLLCQAVDDEKNLLGAVFLLEAHSTALVDQLKDVIKARIAPTLDHLAANQLTLWKLSMPLQITDDDAAFDELLAAFFRDPESVARQLNPAFDVGD